MAKLHSFWVSHVQQFQGGGFAGRGPSKLLGQMVVGMEQNSGASVALIAILIFLKRLD